jgi:succinate-acetate transporter protein
LNRALQVIFGSLTAWFALLAIGDLTGVKVITELAGWVGLLCGMSGVYTGLAQVLNEVYGRTICPIRQVTTA